MLALSLDLTHHAKATSALGLMGVHGGVIRDHVYIISCKGSKNL